MVQAPRSVLTPISRPRWHPPLSRGLGDLLRSLGTSPDAVAATLAATGVRGTPGDGASCAIARYLRAIVGADPSVRELCVTQWEVRVTRPGWRPSVRVRLPLAARSFVRAFDAGQYPELVAPVVLPASGTSLPSSGQG